MDACVKCGDAIQVIEIRPARGRGPATMLGKCRSCGDRYRRTGTAAWTADPDHRTGDPRKP